MNNYFEPKSIEIIDRVIPCLVNYERNMEFLQDKPHIRFLDLAVSYKVIIDIDDVEIKAVNMNNELFGKIGLSIVELDAIARQNVLYMFGTKIMQVTEEIFPMFALTNKMIYHGAALVRETELLNDVSERFDKDLILLPSSKHEFLIIPESYMSLNYIRETVFSVNLEVVSPDDFLSNNIYKYNRETREITIL